MINIIVITLKKISKRTRGRCIHVFLVYRWNITVIIGLSPNGAASSHVRWWCWRRSCWAVCVKWLKFVVDGASKYRYWWCLSCIGMWLGVIRQQSFIQGPSPVTQLCDSDFENIVTTINFSSWTFSRGQRGFNRQSGMKPNSFIMLANLDYQNVFELFLTSWRGTLYIVQRCNETCLEGRSCGRLHDFYL